MAGYLGAIPVPQATQHRESFTATSGQTTFNTAGYTVGFVDVYLNGVHLTPADVTATNGSDVVIGACLVNDIVDVISYTAFEVANQTFTGTTTMDVAAITGVLTTTAATVFNGGFSANDGSTITTADNTAQLTLKSTDADASIGPVLKFNRSSSSPSANDQLGRIDIVGKNDANEDIDYVRYISQIRDETNGTEDGRMAINTIVNGAIISRINIEPTEAVFNDESNDIDFRVESNNATHALFVQGSDGNVGIGVTAPAFPLTVGGTTLIKCATNDNIRISQQTHASVQAINDAANAFTELKLDGSSLLLNSQSGGNILIGTTAEPSASQTGVRISGTNGQNFWKSSNSGTSGYDQLAFFNGNGLVGTISTSGSATAYNTSSDYRLKTDVQPMTGASDRVLALNPINFKWIADGTRVDGFLAHEAQAVVPEAVTGTHNEVDDEGNAVMQGIDQSKLVPLLVASLQEALARITALEKA